MLTFDVIKDGVAPFETVEFHDGVFATWRDGNMSAWNDELDCADRKAIGEKLEHWLLMTHGGVLAN